jgi:hypothetical protein
MEIISHYVYSAIFFGIHCFLLKNRINEGDNHANKEKLIEEKIPSNFNINNI